MSNETNKTSSNYIHGSTPEEQDRLSLLNELLNKSSLEKIGLTGGEKILDVGSGLGQFSRAMARKAGPSGKVIGVERDTEQLQSALRLAQQAGEKDLVEFRQGDALDLPLKESEWGQFDWVHSRFLLEHLPRPDLAVRQMVQATRPGGRVILLDDDHATFRPYPQPPGFDPLWEAYLRSYDRLGNDPFIGRKLVVLLQEAGLVQINNGAVFFGSCAGQPNFQDYVDNLIGILEGAKQLMLEHNLIELVVYEEAIAGLQRWRHHPAAGLWYSMNVAIGVVP